MKFKAKYIGWLLATIAALFVILLWVGEAMWESR
jgi:hypothetical protein